MRKLIDMITSASILEEGAPVPPMKPGEEKMDRDEQNGDRQATNDKFVPTKTTDPNAKPKSTDGDDADESDEDRDLDAGIAKGEEAKKFLQDKGVIEGYIAEAVEGMFSGALKEFASEEESGGGDANQTIIVYDILWDVEDGEEANLPDRVSTTLHDVEEAADPYADEDRKDDLMSKIGDWLTSTYGSGLSNFAYSVI